MFAPMKCFVTTVRSNAKSGQAKYFLSLDGSTKFITESNIWQLLLSWQYLVADFAVMPQEDRVYNVVALQYHFSAKCRHAMQFI